MLYLISPDRTLIQEIDFFISLLLLYCLVNCSPGTNLRLLLAPFKLTAPPCIGLVRKFVCGCARFLRHKTVLGIPFHSDLMVGGGDLRSTAWNVFSSNNLGLTAAELCFRRRRQQQTNTLSLPTTGIIDLILEANVRHDVEAPMVLHSIV